MAKRPMTAEELQQNEIDTLTAFHEFCEKNGLRYYLAGGTLIGAIRHKGFIPWDDDIDLAMPRPDYMKMVEILKDGKLDEYRFLTQDISTKIARRR
ncbi:MAG: LicD family protein [Oscillospiraceae bacterium]|nr:LicD family protein [Candidatus Equicaccousia limihippi]